MPNSGTGRRPWGSNILRPCAGVLYPAPSLHSAVRILLRGALKQAHIGPVPGVSALLFERKTGCDPPEIIPGRVRGVQGVQGGRGKASRKSNKSGMERRGLHLIARASCRDTTAPPFVHPLPSAPGFQLPPVGISIIFVDLAGKCKAGNLHPAGWVHSCGISLSYVLCRADCAGAGRSTNRFGRRGARRVLAAGPAGTSFPVSHRDAG